uniref:Forkhead box protein M1 n=1 Tax=Callorhinchus milii TaxID=7868 RepID=A0A4W3J3M9_CALMI
YTAQKEVEKENQEPPAESSSVESVHERPPYSYMAMIQFAINSTQSKRMTLKEIYTWIEDHFPYFKHVAKPGWKNSIRHNLSLHDMFIRQTSHNGKISHWTIRAEANQVGFRKMKPLLPRTDSYLVPIPLSLNSPLILQPSTHITLPSLQVPLTSSTYTELTLCHYEHFSGVLRDLAVSGAPELSLEARLNTIMKDTTGGGVRVLCSGTDGSFCLFNKWVWQPAICPLCHFLTMVVTALVQQSRKWRCNPPPPVPASMQ